MPEANHLTTEQQPATTNQTERASSERREPALTDWRRCDQPPEVREEWRHNWSPPKGPPNPLIKRNLVTKTLTKRRPMFDAGGKRSASASRLEALVTRVAPGRSDVPIQSGPHMASGARLIRLTGTSVLLLE